jgi:hypothetical protein
MFMPVLASALLDPPFYRKRGFANVSTQFQGAIGFIDWLGQLGLGNLIWTYNRSSPHAEQPEAFAASVKVFVRTNEHIATIMKVAPHRQDVTFGIEPTQPLLRPDGMCRAIDFKRHRRK